MLIKFTDVLRVVVSSANIYEVDWSELGQVIWFQDFPHNTENVSQSNDFSEVLTEFFDSCFNDTNKEMLIEHSKAKYIGFECPEELSEINFSTFIRGGINFSDYNFNSASVSLLPSINGQVPNERRNKYGIYRFADLISNCENLTINPTSEVIYQSTSYGNLSKSYLDKFIDTLTNTTNEFGEAACSEEERPTLKLIYPTQEYINLVQEERK
mmetsp:Transcript_9060/g.8053  ORF Transcript_9060/g.8053 Transcript_9060/m.8053 type:complete len:212 (+) Transcript_9060:396-1031(+)